MYCKVVFLFCLFIIQPWFYPVVKYCFNAICFTRFICVNSVVVSSNISCNDLSWDFIVMYFWYFASWNSMSVSGAIWPSLSPCTVINPILLTYLLNTTSGNYIYRFSKMGCICHFSNWLNTHIFSVVSVHARGRTPAAAGAGPGTDWGNAFV